MHRMKAFAFVLWVFILVSSAAQAAESSWRISYSAPATVYLPLWTAKEAGFFKKHNLSVDLVHVGSSPIALAALMTDETQVLVGGGTVAPTAFLQGNRDLALFARMNNRFVFAVYSHPSIQDVQGLRGKKVGVTRFGGSLEFATRYYLKQNGIDPRKDVSLIQIGRVPDIGTALVAGTIDAGTVSFPHHLLLKKLGYREIADLSKSGVRYASTGFVAKRSFLMSHKAQFEGFIKALVESIHYVKTNRREATKILARYTRLDDMDVLRQDLDQHADNIWPRIPEIHPDDLKLIIEHLGETNAKAKDISPADVVYPVPVRDVAESGFADQVTGKQ